MPWISEHVFQSRGTEVGSIVGKLRKLESPEIKLQNSPFQALA